MGLMRRPRRRAVRYRGRTYGLPAGGAIVVDEERLRSASSLGLTPWEARVYVALLDLGESKAADITHASTVPRGRIYDLLERLHAKGAVEFVPTVPRRFRAIPPDRLLERNMAELRLKVKELEGARELLSRRLLRTPVNASRAESSVVLFRGRKAVLARFRDLVGSAGHEILGYSSERCVVRQASFAAAIYEERANVGVDIRLAVNITKDNFPAVKALAPHVDVRHHGLGNHILTVFVVDGQHAILVHWNPDDDDLRHGDDLGISSDDPGFSRDLRTMVLDRWEHGVDASVRYGQLKA